MRGDQVMKRVWLSAFFVWTFCSFCDGAFAASDYQITLNNNGILDYRVTSVSSPDVYSGSLPADDPVLNLQIGKRYAFTIVNASVHPFEVIAKGSSAGNDLVLLSMGDPVGSLESDPEIGWADNGLPTNGVVEFTVTERLVQAMQEGGRNPGYRCRPHAAFMRGNFNIPGVGGEGEPDNNPDKPFAICGCAAPGASGPASYTMDFLLILSTCVLLFYLKHRTVFHPSSRRNNG
jgi:hypothetical protein